MRCYLCGYTKHKIIRRKLRQDIRRDVMLCQRCGLVFLRPLIASAKEFYKKSYRKIYGPNLKKVAKSKEIFDTYFPFQKDIIAEIKHILRLDMKVLDVGCSTGHFLAALKGKVKTRVGIELNKDEADFIRKNLDFKVYSEPIEKLDLPEGPFDLITALQVLEHVDDPRRFLKNLARHLKPNGYLYLELPNINDALLSCYKSSGYEEFYYREPHLFYFSRKTLRLLLNQVGFAGKIGNTQRYNFLNHLHWIFTNDPQTNFIIGNSDPVLIDGKNVNAKAKNDFNGFIKRVDKEYKQLIAKHWLGESLTFLGHKI